jgi:cobalamin-dependent methionine synthase I
MSIEGLSIIGESINDSVPSTHKMFEENDIEGIIELAKFQAEKGAKYIDVNVGLNTPGFMADMVQKIQRHISLPLSIDTPDPELAAAGLRAYDPELAGGKKPILNSISEARLEMFDIYKEQPFIPILLTTEGTDENGEMIMNKTAEATYGTAERMVQIARERMGNPPNQELILDPGITPIGSDSEGNFKRLMTTIQMIHNNPDFKGINMSVGLSNFTVMLPPKTSDGKPVKSALESAFLTMALPLGFNMIIGSVKRKYRILEAEHPAMKCLNDVLNLEGFDIVTRVMEYYS